MRVAITREVSSSLARCELTHRQRQPIDIGLARRQHRDYCTALASMVDRVITLAPLDDRPDAVFVEDPAMVLDEIGIMTRPGAASRRPERDSLRAAIEPYRRIDSIDSPGTLEGGDVVRLGRTLYVGRSGRTNDEGMCQLATLVRPHGYDVVPVQVTGCLHLKSACSALDDGRLLCHRPWFDSTPFAGVELVDVPATEPAGANVLVVEGCVLLAESHRETARLLREIGLNVAAVDVSELLKAESGVTCSSLIFAHEESPQ